MAPPTTPKRLSEAASSSSPLARSSRTPPTPATPSPFTVEQDMDDPTATPTSYIRSNTRTSSTATSTAPPPQNDDSDGEDEAPDYLRLLSTLNPKSKSSSATSGGIVIPKRGEKDFEPTGFGGQSKLLERSREAMFQAVSGERRVGSRSLVRAIWDAKTRRARLLDVQGKIFETVGVIRREQMMDKETGKMVTKAWNELLPEEALFLAERGSLQIYERAEAETNQEEEVLAPMSLQQAFAALMLPAEEGKGEDEPLTREAYLIYAYLKRLGYVVQRASIVDAVRAAPISASALAKTNQSNSFTQDQMKAQGVIADPERPIKLVTIWDALLYIPRRIAQLGGDAARAVFRWMQWVWRKTIARAIAMIAAVATRVLRSGRSANAGSLGLGLGLKAREDGRRFLGEKGAVEWDSYDAVFSSLQIVPSGHDFWLPSTSCSTTAEAASTIQQPLGSESRPDSNLAPFYYAWRPATLYRKSHPPPPEFRIVILNARTTPLPSIWQFESIFAQIPIPGSDQELFGTIGGPGGDHGESPSMSEADLKERLEYEKQLKASNEAKNRAAYGKFSEGKQKYLREKAALRQAAAAERRANAASQAGWWKRVVDSGVGRALIKVLLLDFRLLKMVAKVFRHCPPGCWSEKGRFSNHGRGGGKFKGRNNGSVGESTGRGGRGNPFPPLKAGRRTVVVAVVDGSITTLLRFGESDFAHWALYSTQTQPQSQQQQQQKAGEEKEAENQASTQIQ
ncbi:uncharacterized protein UTRI_05690_B [Ustilago trichophora]|uniref:tRNA-splicing endonuclease subunit Sen54 N-terminal domain-containing protein n=1 Tax=Ustilago trichophora TaxID=86804 RepID=A0A5C3ERN8_9BASI|nr:uncharacterized protein UTRI_05690_B [Ustilago trichophora]